jgi:hypothetical protein
VRPLPLLAKLCASVFVLALVLAEGLAFGQWGGDRSDDGIHLDFQAPPGCPDATAFRTELRARNRRLRAGKRVVGDLGVTVSEVGNRLSASLVVRSGGKVIGTRRVEGETCKDVIVAIALAAALDLDALAESTPEVAPLGPTESSTSSPPPPPPVPKPAWAWQFGIGAHASLTTGVANAPLIGVPGFIDLGTRPRGLVSPSLRLVFEGTESGSVPEAVGALRFTWFIGALEACPLRWGSPLVALRPCARLEAGVLRGTPEQVSFGHEVTQPWVSGGIVARAEWVPIPLIFFEIEGGARVPFLREQFVFLPGETLYRVPPVSPLVEAGVGVHFL